jgi:hypothetical protein
MSPTVHSLNTGAHDLIDYLMVFALFLLLVVLSLPTIIHLSAILKEDGSRSRHAQQTEDAPPLFANVPSSSRLTPII